MVTFPARPVLFGANSATPTYIELAIRGNLALPAGQPGIMAMGSDGTLTRYLKTDTAGSLSTTNATVSARFGVSQGVPQTKTTSGTTILYTPTSGARVRLKWVGLFTPDTTLPSDPPTNAVATLSLGGTPIYTVPLGQPGAFSHSTVREGPVDGTLTIGLDVAATLYINFDVEEF